VVEQATDVRGKLDYANQAVPQSQIPADANIATIDQAGNVTMSPSNASQYPVSPSTAPQASTVTPEEIFYAKQPGGPVSPAQADALTTQTTGTTGAEKGFFDSTMDSVTDFYNQNLSPSRGMANVPTLEAEIARIQEAYPKMAAANVEAAAKASIAKQTPGLISQYGPLAAVGTAGAAGLGFFTPTDAEDPNLADRRTGSQLIEEDPSRYLIPTEGITPRRYEGPTLVGADYGYTPRPMPMYEPTYNPFVRPEMMAAAGGEVYPRRNGGIMPNEGIPDQDSVRALLMPGEFVMTKNAVRGLGGGNLNQGINNMYSMMRNLEAKGQVA
jgi:hypothetical protein